MNARPEELYPYPFRRGTTHYAGCWQSPGHHNCAVQKIDRFNIMVDSILDILDSDLPDDVTLTHIGDMLTTYKENR